MSVSVAIHRLLQLSSFSWNQRHSGPGRVKITYMNNEVAIDMLNFHGKPGKFHGNHSLIYNLEIKNTDVDLTTLFSVTMLLDVTAAKPISEGLK